MTPVCESEPWNELILGMHDIIGLISESANNGFKGKYRHRPDMKNYADKRNTLPHMCSGCVSDLISSVWFIPEAQL